MSTTSMMEGAAEMSPRIGSGMSTGRILGVLLLVHLVGGLIVPFVFPGYDGVCHRPARASGIFRDAPAVQYQTDVLLLY